ncbi:hypothetical protein [Photobacterium kishitanii]|uniref:Uncharacterized protein n=1 Tax=Photobacterium kishitanii TaxID=318456 RepID=A0A2T3KAZ4_9GAMM|nr:hypothetical protein [Photobacterium kishitanii]PSU89797.1 hypothetical protein C9J27_24250 [Photobacterium kishitanii]
MLNSASNTTALSNTAKHMTLDVVFATTLVLQATTRELIESAVAILKYPATHGFGGHVEISNIQRKLYLEQLERNELSIGLLGHITDY